jgi:hypothetical protein
LNKINDKIFEYYWDWLQYNSPINPKKLQKSKNEELSPIFVKFWEDYKNKIPSPQINSLESYNEK